MSFDSCATVSGARGGPPQPVRPPGRPRACGPLGASQGRVSGPRGARLGAGLGAAWGASRGASGGLPLAGRASRVFFSAVAPQRRLASDKGRSVNETRQLRGEAAFKLKYYRKGSAPQTFGAAARVSEGGCGYRRHCPRLRGPAHFPEGEEGADRVNKNNSNGASGAGAKPVAAAAAPGSGKQPRGPTS